MGRHGPVSLTQDVVCFILLQKLVINPWNFNFQKAVLKVWELDSANCLQTLNFHFPSFKVLGKTIEFGQPAFYTETANPTMMIATCCEHLTRIDLMEMDYDYSSSETSEVWALKLGTA